MKTIVMYINSMIPTGGIERVVSNLCNNLYGEFDIIILTKDEAKSFYELNSAIKIYSLNLPIKLDMKKSRFYRAIQLFKSFIQTHKQLKHILNKLNADYIYVPHIYNAIEVFFSKRRERLIISEHGSYYGYNKIYTIMKRFVYPRAYKLIVPSTMDAAIYNSLKYPVIYIPHHQSFSANSQISDTANNHFILNIGRYTDDKRQDALLKIWKQIVDINKSYGWKLVLIGSGEREQKLKKYVEEHCLEEHIIFRNPVKNINTEYLRAGIFAFTSRYEGFGMVLLEAMSFGLPCISFDCPSGPRDIIKNNENGFLVQDNNSEEFKNKLIELIENSKIRWKFQNNALKTIENWDNSKITEIWKSVLV